MPQPNVLLVIADDHRADAVGALGHSAVPVCDLDEIRRGGAPRVGVGFSTELFCGAAEAFLRTRRPPGRPFFACVALTSPHDPRTPPAKCRALYDAPALPLPKNFQPAHAAGAPPVRATLCSVYMDCQRMVTDGRWKLIVYCVNGAERLQLFDLENDPDECRDLSASPVQGARVAALRAQLQTWQAECGDRWMAPVHRGVSVA